MKSLSSETLRKEIPILEVAARLGLPVARNKTRCLFPERHKNGDRTPSLSFHLPSNTFRCFVCPDVHGSVIDLVMLAKRTDFKGALEYFKTEDFSLSRNGSKAVGRVTVDVYKKNDSQERLTRTNIYGRLFELCDPVDNEGYRYLKSRRLFKKVVEASRIRMVGDYQRISEDLRADFSLTDLRQAGLFNEKGHFRFYKHRLLIPYLKGKEIHFFQARAMDKETVPKELNPAGPIPFPYALYSLKEGGLVYLCEGAIDTLTVIQAGFSAIGIPGVMNFKKEWLPLFKGRKVFSVLDNDEAGRSGNERLKKWFSEAQIPFSIISIPEGKDINDVFNR
ncbi:MAG: hypothetical protein A2293_16330 [Elusimicrobia bacterium RIFOXYB2_FULL_49_7]|nr:MAG: hypothetical protein A2293_16330 [Elusimicrobia bacterium RIFOXYB2_FULL_49_7]